MRQRNTRTPRKRKAPPRSRRKPVRANVRISARGPGVRHRLRALLREHLRSLLFSLGKLARTPLSSLMTMGVMGIALALPGGLYVFLGNAMDVAGGLETTGRISLFMAPGAGDGELEALARTVRAHEGVHEVRTITAEAALEEFGHESGLEAALAVLDTNPLPATLVVTPALEDPAAVGHLAEKLGALPEVQTAQLDMTWLQRLQAIMNLVQRFIFAIAAVLSLATVLVVGNTVRLDIENRKEEIVVIKLIGGTNAFVRRPFLYGGIWYGLGGGLLAVLLIALMVNLMGEPVRHIAVLYHSQFRLHGLDAAETLTLVGVATFLGLVGSWLAVSRHLSRIEPA